MTRRFLVISAALIFIVTPFIAWVVAFSQYTIDYQGRVPDIKVSPAAKNELLETITKKRKQEHFHQDSYDGITVVDIVSYENLDTWWYIVKVKYESYGKEKSITQPMLLVKYYNGPDAITIVTNPGEPLPFYNISDSYGIPYDVIDKYNEAINASQSETGLD